jgi:hypothetical protein
VGCNNRPNGLSGGVIRGCLFTETELPTWNQVVTELEIPDVAVHRHEKYSIRKIHSENSPLVGWHDLCEYTRGKSL